MNGGKRSSSLGRRCNNARQQHFVRLPQTDDHEKGNRSRSHQQKGRRKVVLAALDRIRPLESARQGPPCRCSSRATAQCNALARALTRPSWLEYRDMINGIRQPQLSTTARPSTVVTNPLRADPRRTPLQAPTSAKLPKNPRWPAAEHSTRNIEEVVYSPPTESP